MDRAAKRKITALIVGLFAVLALVTVGTVAYLQIQKKHASTLRLGFIGPLSGPTAAYGVAQMRGIELAVKEINGKKGVQGKKLEVIFEDSQMEPNKSISAMKKLVDIDKVPAVIGETSTTATLAIADIANRSKTILLSPLASGAKITGTGDYIFRISPSDAFQATAMADFVFQRGLRKGAIVFTNDDWGGGLQRAFLEKFKILGGAIVAVEGLPPGTQDFRTQLVKIKELHPDFVYIPLHPNDLGIFLRQAKELGVAAQIVGADTFSEKAILKAAGSTAEGVIFAMAAQPSGEVFSRFARNYKAQYGEDPSYSAAAAYDSLYLLAEALTRGDATGEQIKKFLSTIKDYHGVSGIIGFDRHGDVTTKKFELLRIKNGEYVPITSK
jgi:branched-chain amino acid transport system substrate-binding protein